MNIKRLISAALVCVMLPVGGLVPTVTASAASADVIRLNPADASPFNDGEFQGWGTALCWWANRIGYSPEMTQQAAEAFFSDKGLGLDIARYNLGGGDNPTHKHITRSDSKVPGVWETFKLSADEKNVESITYDITNDQNQLNIAKAALKANPDLYFEGFSNSAPYFMTKSGCTSGGDPASSNNLRDDMYDDFGKFIADATKLFKDNGIVFQSYSPMNEPDGQNSSGYYWGANSSKQEGCRFSPGESQSKAIVETRKALDAAGLTDVLVAGMDETSLKHTYNNLGALTSEAKTALGRIDTHTYSDRGYHAQVKAKATEMKKNLWQSEVDKGGDGFTLASMIIEDMNGMQPSAWVMWDIIDVHRDSSFTDPSGNKTEANNSVTDTSSVWGVGMADHDAKEIKFTNKYYAYGQFTKYIEPGMTIIASSSSTLAAYDKKTGKIVIVALNNDGADKNVTFDLRDFSKTGAKAQVIRTNASSEKWAKKADIAVTNKQFNATLGAKTITTYVLEGDNKPVHYMTIDGSGTIIAGADYNYTIGGTDLDYTEGSVSWSVSDPSMAEIKANAVSNSVKVKAKKGGTFTLTASAGDISTAIEVKALADGQTLTIVNKKSGKGLETKSKSVTSGSQLVQWEDRKLDTAAWKLKATADGHFNIINCNADMLLASVNGSLVISDGAQETDGTAKWDLINHGGYFEIKNVSASKSLNVSGEKVDNGASVILYAFGGGDNELWSLVEAADNLEHVVPEVVDYSKKYAGTDYTFVKNVAAYTNTFSDHADNFTLSGKAKLTADGAGESVLGIQPDNSNKENVGAAGAARLDKSIRCLNGQTVNIAFDLYCSNSGGTADFELLDKDGNEMVKLISHSWDKYTITVGETTAEEATGSKVYLRNYVNDKMPNQLITNGGHFEIYFAPATGDITVTLKNNTNDSPQKTYTGNVGAGNRIKGIVFNANYTTWSKPMYLDNLVTNIVVKAGDVVSDEQPTHTTIEKIDGDTLDASYEIAEEDETENAVLIAALYDNNMLVEAKMEKFTDEVGGKTSFKFSRDVEDYDYRVMLWELSGTAMKPLCAVNSEYEAPAPTDPPVLPASGELISLSFDNGNLTSSSDYGKATALGAASFATVDGRECIQLDNTAASVIKLTDANGNPLLTGRKNITVSFKVKPTTNNTSWWFYAAPDDSAQNNSAPKYLGIFTKDTLHVERYNGERGGEVLPAFEKDKWNDVMITVKDDKTVVYVNGVKSEEVSGVNISDMLGKRSVAYIGKANWGSGEYATGYLDDFVIYNAAIENPLDDITLPDTSAVKSDITVPSAEGVTWESSDDTVITASGAVTRPNSTKTVTLTAKKTAYGIEFKKAFDVTVIGMAHAADTLAAYADNGSIKFTNGYSEGDYDIYVTLAKDNEAVGEAKKNTASGSFDSLENGTYTVICTVKNGETTVKTASRTVVIKAEKEMGAYLFAHFVGKETNLTDEQIYLSVSQDGQLWTTLNGGSPYLTSTVGQKGVRDPYIFRGEDGMFYIIATDLSIASKTLTWSTSQTEGSRNIIVWRSADLKNWTCNTIEAMPDGYGCVWAPEAVYDPAKRAYMVFWASKGRADDYGKHRVYRRYTTDFRTFTTEPEVYIERDHSMIDTTIIQDKGVYYRFTKDESDKYIFMETAFTLDGPWKEVKGYNHKETGFEGPTIYKMNGQEKWCLMLDKYGHGGYQPFVTENLASGEFESAGSISSSVEYRHGTVMPITEAEYTALTAE